MGTVSNINVYKNDPSPTVGEGLSTLRANQIAFRELQGALPPATVTTIGDNYSIPVSSASIILDVPNNSQVRLIRTQGNLSGVSGTAESELHDGMVIKLWGVSGKTVTLKHKGNNSVASYNIRSIDNSDIILSPTIPTVLTYDADSNIWIERERVNTILSDTTGNLTNLTTTNKTNLVAAINEVKGNTSTNATNISNISSKVGTGTISNKVTNTNVVAALNDLITKIGLPLSSLNNSLTKTSLITAINSLATLKANTTDVGTLSNLTTTEKGSLVGAINEIAGSMGSSIGDLTTLATTNKSSIVSAINEIYGTSGVVHKSGSTMTGNLAWKYTATLSGTSTTRNCQITMNATSLNYGVYDIDNSKWVWLVSPSGGCSFYGNANTATKATQDEDGNAIKTTYAKLASPTFTGTPKAPTATSSTNNTQIATTAFVKTAVSNLAEDTAVVHTTGDEEISGIKTHKNDIIISESSSRFILQMPSVDTKQISSTSQIKSAVVFADKNGSDTKYRTAAIQSGISNKDSNFMYLFAYNPTVDSTSYGGIRIYCNRDGNYKATAPSTLTDAEIEASNYTEKNNDIVTRDFIPKDTRIVHTTGNETVNGQKTFTTTPKIVRVNPHLVFSETDIEKGVLNNTGYQGILFKDKNETELGSILYHLYENGDSYIQFQANAASTSDATGSAVMYLIKDANGNSIARAPSTLTTRTEGTDIVTRDFIPVDTRIVHTTGDETIDGTKTFSSAPTIDKNDSPAAGSLSHIFTVKFKNTTGTKTHTAYPISYIGTDNTSDAYNTPIRLGSTNGMTVVTAGESATTFCSVLNKYNDENLYLESDNEIQMYVKCANNMSTFAGPITFSGTAASGGPGTTSITADNFIGKASTVDLSQGTANLSRYVYFASNQATDTEAHLVYNSKFMYNPSTDELKVGSITGTANKANSFSSAQDITLSGDVEGTASSTAGWNITTKRRSCILGQNVNSSTNPWYKVCSTTFTTANTDKQIVFLVEDTYNVGGWGLLRLQARTSGSKAIIANQIVCSWLAMTGFTLADFVLVYTADTNPVVELWVKIASGFDFRRFTVLSEGSRYTTERMWTLYDASSAGQEASIPTTGTQVISTVASLVS